jgi:hypothetical protein
MWFFLLLSSSLVGCANDVLKKDFYTVGQRVLGMSLWNKGGGGHKKFRNHFER